jgi:tetratricopeptide (TPR) repeat protein
VANRLAHQLSGPVSICFVLLFPTSSVAEQDDEIRAEVEEAFDQGREFLAKRTYPDLQRAIEEFQRAIALDPGHARAYAGLADAYSLIYQYGKAEKAARQALALDGSLPEAHASLGFILMHAHWDWAAADRHLQRSIELDPRYAPARHWHAIYLEIMGEGEEAVAEARSALGIEPRSSVYALGVGYRLFWARRYPEAISQLRAVLETHPGTGSAHYYLGRCYVEIGRFELAAARFARAAELDPRNRNVDGARAYLAARAGNIDEAKRILRSLLAEGQPFASHIASIYVALGDHDEAFHWLNRAVAGHGVAVVWLRVDPRFDPVRSDNRFEAILARLGLAAAGTRPPAPDR